MQQAHLLSLSRFITHHIKQAPDTVSAHHHDGLDVSTRTPPSPKTVRLMQRCRIYGLLLVFLGLAFASARPVHADVLAPTNLVATPLNVQARISFTPPSTVQLTTIDNYKYSTDGGTNFITFSPAQNSSPLTISGLTNGTAYNIQLKAVCTTSGSVPCSGAASSTISVTPTAQVPTTPFLVGSTSGNAQASISFTQASNNGSTITNYQYSSDGGINFTAFSPAQNNSPVTITGLTNGTAYSIKLKAVNSVGPSAPSSGTLSVTPGLPAAPSSLNATAGDAQASISFTAGANNGSSITNYQYSITGGTYFTAFSPAQTSSPVTIVGLTNGTPYSIKLKAVNSVGAGTASSTVSVMPITTPSAPSALIGTPGAASAVLNYTAGATGGSAITNYQYSIDGGVSFTTFNPFTTGNPLTITGLTNGTTYSLALKAVSAVGAGTASSTISVTPNGACGVGVPLTTGTAGVGSLWQMLALPCVSATSSIAEVFGTGTLSNLITANYAVNQNNVTAENKNGWLIEKRTVGATPAYEPLITSDLALEVGMGYWIKSFQAPTGGLLAMAGTTTPAVVTQAQGCASVNGCKAITVTTYQTTAGVNTNRYNLVGNPFAYPIDWTKVRVRVDGSSSTLTPSAASAAGYMSNAVNIWNGTGYVAFTDVTFTSTPNLQYFKSFWVNVLPGAYGHTVELLIPAEQSTQPVVFFNPAAPSKLEQLATIEMPWYMGWLDWVIPPAAAAVPVVKTPVKPQALPNFKDWTIRLKVNNPVTGWQDNGNLLGQLSDAQVGYDNHDVPEMTPFAAPYLTLVFPHQNWLTNAADYCGDFHSPSKKVDSWTFEIRANPVGSKVFLSWAGEAALLKRSRLIDAATGKVIKASDKRWAKNGYPITLKKDVQRYTWKVLAK